MSVDRPGAPSLITAAETELAGEPGVQPQPVHWTPLKRFGFRFSFCYYAVWITLNGNATVWKALPEIGSRTEAWLWAPLGGLSVLLGEHVFHIHGAGAHWVSRGASDSLLCGILTGCYVLIAVAAATLWTVLDRRRESYQTMLAWLRFALRLTLGIALLSYGVSKLFPSGVPPLDLAALHTPAGSLPPALLLWTARAASPGLSVVGGLVEILIGAMLLYRRTALFGALLTFFSIGVVFSVELFFAMPVRIFTGHMLMAAGSIILPDLAATLRFFWSHQYAAPAGVWLPPERRARFRRATGLTELVVLVLMVGSVIVQGSEQMYATHEAAQHPLPFQGGWRIAAASPAGSGALLVSKSGKSITSVWFNRQIGRHDFALTLVSVDGRFWQGWGTVHPADGTLMLRGRYTAPHTYRFVWQGRDVLVLQREADAAQGAAEWTLVRIPEPQTWRLLEQDQPLGNERGYAR
jgi:hypothetical protein